MKKDKISKPLISGFKKNKGGNDIKPKVTEIFRWQEKTVVDSSGYQTAPFVFTFPAGEHTLTLKGSRGMIAVAEIVLSAPKRLKNYEQYKAEIRKKENGRGNTSKIEAEHMK